MQDDVRSSGHPLLGKDRQAYASPCTPRWFTCGTATAIAPGNREAGRSAIRGHSSATPVRPRSSERRSRLSWHDRTKRDGSCTMRIWVYVKPWISDSWSGDPSILSGFVPFRGRKREVVDNAEASRTADRPTSSPRGRNEGTPHRGPVDARAGPRPDRRQPGHALAHREGPGQTTQRDPRDPLRTVRRHRLAPHRTHRTDQGRETARMASPIQGCDPRGLRRLHQLRVRGEGCTQLRIAVHSRPPADRRVCARLADRWSAEGLRQVRAERADEEGTSGHAGAESGWARG